MKKLIFIIIILIISLIVLGVRYKLDTRQQLIYGACANEFVGHGSWYGLCNKFCKEVQLTINTGVYKCDVTLWNYNQF